MKTKTIQLYNLEELSKKAQEKAHEQWRAGNDYFFLEDCMAERLHELLEEHGIKRHKRHEQGGHEATPVLYSLSCCQGDGAMFEGVFEWKGWTVKVKHSGRYYHYNSKTFEMYKESEEGDITEASEAEEQEFNQLYVKICKELERYGYDFMEHEDSFEAFQEACEANEYTFREDGTMEN